MRRRIGRTRGKTRHVGKQYGGFVIGVGDRRTGFLLQAFGDSRRQDIDQQTFRTLLLTVGCRLGALHLLYRVEDDGVQNGGIDHDRGGEIGQEQQRLRCKSDIPRQHDFLQDHQPHGDDAERKRDQIVLGPDDQDGQRGGDEIAEKLPPLVPTSQLTQKITA